MRRIVTWGNTHPFTMAASIALFFTIVMGASLIYQNTARANEIEREARARAVVVAETARTTCVQAVVAVSDQAKIDNLEIIEVIKTRFAETGRPVPPLYVALEAKIQARRAPVEACEPTTP